MGMVRKILANEPLKDVTVERVRVEEFEESLCKDCGWVNLVFLYGLSLKILSGSSQYFVGIRGIYTGVRKECEVTFFHNKVEWRLGLMTWLSRRSKPRANWMASLDFLSCSAIASMMVQLLCMLHSCASSSSLQAASHPRDPVASPCFTATSWAFLHTLSHTTLTWFPPKHMVTNC